jgi:mono/diheme cytochrome c family protein
VFEPSRQAGATTALEDKLVGWGRGLFRPTADGGFNCAGCHGGMKANGGTAPYTVTDPVTQQVRAVNWYAPALNTVLYRFDDSEVTYILTYGRPGSPMSAWGLDGGGPMNAQQIQTLIEYIRSIQIPREDCSKDEQYDPNCPSGHLPAKMQADIEKAARQSVADGTYTSYGQALFNLNLNSGAYSCARCHTKGWSYGDPGVPGQGAFGWNLTGGDVTAKFPSQEAMKTFVQNGSVNGAPYAPQSQGSGKMPGFGQLLTDQQLTAIIEYVRTL